MKTLFLSAVVAGVMAYHGVTSAKAAMVIGINQVGSNVVATGSGSIDTTYLTLVVAGSGFTTASMNPSLGEIAMTSASPLDWYSGLTGPASFGSDGTTLANTSSGDAFTLTKIGVEDIVVAHGYMSGSALSNNATYNNTILTLLNLLQGSGRCHQALCDRLSLAGGVSNSVANLAQSRLIDNRSTFIIHESFSSL